MPQGFREMTSAGTAAYLDTVIDHGVSRAQLLARMEVLLRFTEGATYIWPNDFRGLLTATIVRSTRTFAGICTLLRQSLAVQAAMLGRALFEDVAVAHWLALNQDDSDWLVARFFRQRDAIGLHQEALRKETGFAIAPPFGMSRRVHPAVSWPQRGRRVDAGLEGSLRSRKDRGLRPASLTQGWRAFRAIRH